MKTLQPSQSYYNDGEYYQTKCILMFNAVMTKNITHHADKNCGDIETLSIVTVG